MSFSDLPVELVRGVFEEVFVGNWVTVLDWDQALSLRLVCSTSNHLVAVRG
jgi:hypothetical protein